MTKYRPIGAGVDGLARIGQALASPVRIRALQALRTGELCLCELTDLFGMAPSTLSKHMSLLLDAGLVQSRRDGKWTHYALPGNPEEAVAEALGLVELLASRDPMTREDAGRIAQVACR
jgi:DNA-binding transcriptional ArsR family regulator